MEFKQYKCNLLTVHIYSLGLSSTAQSRHGSAYTVVWRTERNQHGKRGKAFLGEQWCLFSFLFARLLVCLSCLSACFLPSLFFFVCIKPVLSFQIRSQIYLK